jgi:hypothetical protein
LEKVEDRISGLEDKIDIKEKTKILRQGSKATKRICKNSVTPSKEQICESWALKKRCKPKGYVIHSTK